MVQKRLGRYWKQAKRWFLCKNVEENRSGSRKKISKMRASSESEKNDQKGQRRSAVARKRAAANVGPKPTNVKTFAKKRKTPSSNKRFQHE